MAAPFDASSLKLARAAKHLEELKVAASDYLALNPVRIVVEPFPHMEKSHGTQAWIARIDKPVPFEFSAIIGDVVHNLRAALDLLACDLVRLAGKPIRSVYFPFCEGHADLLDTIKKRNLHRAGPDVVAVVRSLKPYKGGNIALRAIHDMDIADKHQAMLPVIGATTVPLGSILQLPPEHQLQTLSTIIAQDGQIVVGLPASITSPPLGAELPSRFFLALQNAPGIGNREMFEALHDLTKAADGVFDALTALRPGATFPISPY
jgi:hypothetical protein